MSAHTHAHRLKMLQQQQQAQNVHNQQYHARAQQRASLPSIGYGDGPPSVSAYSGHPPAQARYSQASYAPSNNAPSARHGPPSGMVHAHSQGSLASQPVSVSTFGGGYSAYGGPRRSTNRYAHSNLRTSKSLGGSRASLASQKSMKSTIQMENHDRRVRGQMSSVWFGKARVPFYIAITLFIIGGILIMSGSIWTGLAYQGRIYIPIDNSRAIGPIIIAVGILVAGIGFKFFYDAYQVSNAERRRLKVSFFEKLCFI